MSLTRNWVEDKVNGGTSWIGREPTCRSLQAPIRNCSHASVSLSSEFFPSIFFHACLSISEVSCFCTIFSFGDGLGGSESFWHQKCIEYMQNKLGFYGVLCWDRRACLTEGSWLIITDRKFHNDLCKICLKYLAREL